MALATNVRVATRATLALMIAGALSCGSDTPAEDATPDTDVAPDTSAHDGGVDTATPAASNACGGTTTLMWEDLPASPLDRCGCNEGGVLVCNGGDTLRCVGAPALNSCGGCAQLTHDVGDACGPCGGGLWVCDGGNRLACAGPAPSNACGGCGELAEAPETPCPGADTAVWVCRGPETLACMVAINPCGGAQPLTYEGSPGAPGDPCANACGEVGALRCAGTEALACSAPSATTNACGGCAPLTGAPGDVCDGCDGTLGCDPGGEFVSCQSDPPNRCGGCGELDDATCPNQSLGYCEGPDALVCPAESVERNACGGSRTLDGTLGAPCGVCERGVWRCDGLDALVCDDPGDVALNPCGGCGRLPGAPGDPCGAGRIFACDAGGYLTCEVTDTCAAAGDDCHPLARCEAAGEGYTCVCPAGYEGDGQTCTSCTDGVQNSDETDVDCGGPICDGCGLGGSCETHDDCWGADSVCDQRACVEVQTITTEVGEDGDHFGVSVALSGDLLVVGAYEDDDCGDGAIVNCGSAYVFRRAGLVWTEEARLTPTRQTTAQRFGWAVAIDGDVAIIGANGEDDNVGAAYAFRYTGGEWSQEQRLFNPDGAFADVFGASVAVRGNVALVGARGEGVNHGAAYVFRYADGAWSTSPERLTPADSGLASFGNAVALGSGMALIGGEAHDATRGAVWVFNAQAGSFVEGSMLTASDGATDAHFGYSVAVDGDVALIGARGADDRGAAYVFRQRGGEWTEEARIDNPTSTDDFFGHAVAITGDLAFIGAPRADLGAADTGAVYAFRREGEDWVEAMPLTPSSLGADDGLGSSVAADGSWAAVGAPGTVVPGATFVVGW